MHSRHATTLALLTGAFALVFAVAGIFALKFLSLSTGESLTSKALSSNEEDVERNIKPPRFLTKIEGSNAVIAEVDNTGETLRAIYTSSLLDTIGDFSLFAVPQEHYQGVIYVQAIMDSGLQVLKIYPLNVELGQIGPSILNIPFDTYTISRNQERIAVVYDKSLTIFSLTTGKALSAWQLNANELWSADITTAAKTYSGKGGTWTSEDCFEHEVWYGEAQKQGASSPSLLETRQFCLE